MCSFPAVAQVGLQAAGMYMGQKATAKAAQAQMDAQAKAAITEMNYAFQNYEQERVDAFDSAVESADVYNDTDAAHGWHGEVHASKWRRGNGNHDRAPVCADIIWRVRPDHESADGTWCGL